MATPTIDSRFDDTAHAVAGDAAHDSAATLGRVVFGAASGRPAIVDDVPTLHMAMCPKAGFIETWRARGPVRAGTFNGLVYAHDGEFLFCAGFIPSSGHYTEPTRQAYADAFTLIRELTFPKLVRMWNFIPQINGENRDGLEVYRDFCRGRAMAFEQEHARLPMPAATGIGTWGEGVAFYFLACRESAVTHLENTRQTPAYDYPRRYGPKPPSFARATLLGATLFVSGTASIVGHETVHAGDLDKQFAVAIDNIAHLIGARNLSAQGVTGGYALADLDQIKVYYRHADDLPRVMRLSREAFSPHAAIRYLKVDICRADLLVEIEGIAVRRVI